MKIIPLLVIVVMAATSLIIACHTDTYNPPDHDLCSPHMTCIGTGELVEMSIGGSGAYRIYHCLRLRNPENERYFILYNPVMIDTFGNELGKADVLTVGHFYQVYRYESDYKKYYIMDCDRD